MPEFQSQEFLFHRIKELLPPHASLVDTVAEILHISSDSAYRRIRGETPVDGSSGYSAEEIYHIRHHSLFVPRDFDLSPYFSIVKPTIAAGFNYKTLVWSDQEAGKGGQSGVQSAVNYKKS